MNCKNCGAELEPFNNEKLGSYNGRLEAIVKIEEILNGFNTNDIDTKDAIGLIFGTLRGMKINYPEPEKEAIKR